MKLKGISADVEVDVADLKRQLAEQGLEVVEKPKPVPKLSFGDIVFVPARVNIYRETGDSYEVQVFGQTVSYARRTLESDIPDDLIQAYEELYRAERRHQICPDRTTSADLVAFTEAITSIKARSGK